MSPDGATLTKFVAVQRSDRVPTLSWWSLPLPLQDVATLYADTLDGAFAVVHPASALGDEAARLGAEAWPGGTARVTEVRALLAARQDGRVAPCTIAVFPPTARAAAVRDRAARFRDELERLGFTIALVPEGDGRARHRFCFRVPGKVVRALEHLAHGRGFGGDPGQVEMALLQGLALRPKHTAHLRLVMADGGARLVGDSAGGHRLVTYLESAKGYTGVFEERTLREATRARVQEAWRRFPVGVVMFAGLPFFIAAFWIHSLLGGRAVQTEPEPTR